MAGRVTAEEVEVVTGAVPKGRVTSESAEVATDQTARKGRATSESAEVATDHTDRAARMTALFVEVLGSVLADPAPPAPAGTGSGGLLWLPSSHIWD